MLLGIKDASLILGRHPNSLRCYDRNGLLKPARDKNGYRRYCLKDILRFKAEYILYEKAGHEMAMAIFESKQRTLR